MICVNSFLFTKKVVNMWNSLPNHVVYAKSTTVKLLFTNRVGRQHVE